jgi:hypothetical protein
MAQAFTRTGRTLKFLATLRHRCSAHGAKHDPRQGEGEARPRLNLHDHHPKNLHDRHPQNPMFHANHLFHANHYRHAKDFTRIHECHANHYPTANLFCYLLFHNLLFAILSFATCVPPQPPRISICQEKNCNWVKKINDFFSCAPSLIC